MSSLNTISRDIKDWWVNQAKCTRLVYDREILADLDDEDYEDYYEY